MGFYGLNKASFSVSVIIPTLDRISLLEKALISVFSQTLPVNEIIVVDNGSSDGTQKMLSLSFPNVIAISEKKKGVSFARNAGILIAKSDWIAFLDSDDEWMPKKMEKQAEAYFHSDRKSRLIHTNELWFRQKKFVNQAKKHQKQGGYIYRSCLPLCCISPSSAVIKANLFQELVRIFLCEENTQFLAKKKTEIFLTTT